MGSAGPTRQGHLDHAGGLAGRPRRDVREVRPRRRPRAGPGTPAPDRPRHTGAQPRLRGTVGHRLDLAAPQDRPGRRGHRRHQRRLLRHRRHRRPARGGPRPAAQAAARRRSGWNCAFFIRRDGVPDIDFLYTSARIVHDPTSSSRRSTRRRCGRAASGSTPTSGARCAATGSPTGRSRTSGWSSSGTAWSPTNRKTFPDYLDVKGQVLIGRDEGARALRGLKQGTQLKIKARPQPRPKVAITGNVFLIRDGITSARDDREMHPRTAIGID